MHGVEAYLLRYRLVPGRLVGSKKNSVALSDAVSTSAGCFAKRSERIHSPRRDESGFLFLFTESTCVCYRDSYFIEIIIRCNSSVKKLKLESLKFGSFRAIERQNI